MSNSEPYANPTVFSYRNAFFNYAATANKTASANSDIAIENSTGGNVAVIFYYCVVFKQCEGVDDAIVAHFSTGIDNGAVHDDSSRTKYGVT